MDDASGMIPDARDFPAELPQVRDRIIDLGQFLGQNLSHVDAGRLADLMETKDALDLFQ